MDDNFVSDIMRLIEATHNASNSSNDIQTVSYDEVTTNIHIGLRSIRILMAKLTSENYIISIMEIIKTIYKLSQLTMSDQQGEQPSQDTGDDNKVVIVVVGLIILVLLAIAVYFWGPSLAYVLTWPYHAICSLGGTSEVTAVTTTVASHWLLPFIDVPVVAETVLAAGAGELVQAVGALASAAWAVLLGYGGYKLTQRLG
jgi:hypothetical protein